MLYLDQAATSWPKPPAVLEAMNHWYRELGVSAARGSSMRCAQVDQLVDRARSKLATMTGMHRQRVAFTSGATESIPPD